MGISRKGLIKLGKWSAAVLFVTLVSFFLGQYVMQVLAAHTATVFWHDGSGASPGNRVVGVSTSTTFNISVVRASGGDTISSFEISVPVGWNITDVDEPSLVGFSSCSCANGFYSGQVGGCNADGGTGKGLVCTGASIGATPGLVRFTVRAPSSSTNASWGWTTTDSAAANQSGLLYSISLDNGDIGFDVRQASNNELPQTAAQVSLIVSNNSNSTTVPNNTEWGDGLYLFESGFFNTRLTGSVTNYSFTVTRASDFMRAPNKIVSYSAGAANEQRVTMNNTAEHGLNITVSDELNTTRTWGDITISLYNLTTGTGACSDSELLFRNTTPPGVNSLYISLSPIGATTGVYAQANKTGYVKTPCVQLNVSSINSTNVTFIGQFNLDLKNYGTTGRAANCTTPVIVGANSTCGGLNFTTRFDNVQNQLGGVLSLGAENTSFIGFSTFSTALTPAFLSGDAYINSTGSGRIAINRTGYVIQNTSGTITTNADRQQIVNFLDTASTAENYVAGLALNYTIKVFAFDEASRFILLAGAAKPGSVSNGTLRNSTGGPADWTPEISFATEGVAYVAALTNGTVGYNLSVSKDGFVNRTFVVTPSPWNMTAVYFGNGTDTTCSGAAEGNTPRFPNCTSSILFTVKITGQNVHEQKIYGFTVRLNDSADNGTVANATDGSTIEAGTIVPGDVNGTAEGILYWAVNTSNITNPVVINVTTALTVGYMEWNRTGLYINNSQQLALTSYNNFSYFIRVQSEFMHPITGNLVNNVTYNASGINQFLCSQNSTNGNVWGCNVTINVPNSYKADVNMTAASGYSNASNNTQPTAVPQRWGIAPMDNYTANFSLIVYTRSDFGYALLGTNITSVNFTGTPATNCRQNSTNTSAWGCNISFSVNTNTGFITANATAGSGYLNALNATNFSIPSGPNAQYPGNMNNITTINPVSLLVTTRDEFGNAVLNPSSSNVTNVSSSAQICFENVTDTTKWGCPFSLSTGAVVLRVNITGNQSGYINSTNSTPYSLASATVGSQTNVNTSMLFAILVRVADEFGLPIYSPSAGVNVSDVIFTANTEGDVTCLKNATNTSIWGCRVDAGNATGKLTVNFTQNAGFFNFTFFNQPPTDSATVAQNVNTTTAVYTINVTTLSEFNVSLTGNTNVTYQNTSGVLICTQSPVNQTRWGCPANRGAAAFAVSVVKPGYLNYTTAALSPNARTITFSNYTVLLKTIDEFNNPIYSIGLNLNVTNVTYRNSSSTIACDLNTTNTTMWGCPIPVTFNLGVISVNLSQASGYMNGTNATTYALPYDINTNTQNLTITRNNYTVLVRTMNEFGHSLNNSNTIFNVTDVRNATSSDPCVKNATNNSVFGCRLFVGGPSTMINVNVSNSSGYLNYTFNITPPADSSSMQIANISLNPFAINVTTATELNNGFTADYVFFENSTGSATEFRTMCIQNQTNASIWGCPANITVGYVNVTADDYANWSSSAQAKANATATKVTSANLFTLRVSANGSAAGVGLTNANVTVYNSTRVYSYTAANVTTSDNGLYYFNVSSITNPIVTVLASLFGYESADSGRGLSISNTSQRQTAISITKTCAADSAVPAIQMVTPLNQTNVSVTRPNITFTITDSGSQDCGVNINNISVTGITTFNAANNCTGSVAKYTCSFLADTQTDATNVSFNIDASDKAGNSASRLITQIGVDTTFSITSSLIEIIRDTAVVNNSFDGGWAFRFNISTGSGGNATRMKMANWTLASDSSAVIPIHTNVRMNYTDTQGNKRIYNVTNSYNETESVFGIQDIDSGKSGNQGNVTVFIKIPLGTTSGSYSTTFQFALYKGA